MGTSNQDKVVQNEAATHGAPGALCTISSHPARAAERGAEAPRDAVSVGAATQPQAQGPPGTMQMARTLDRGRDTGAEVTSACSPGARSRVCTRPPRPVCTTLRPAGTGGRGRRPAPSFPSSVDTDTWGLARGKRTMTWRRASCNKFIVFPYMFHLSLNSNVCYGISCGSGRNVVNIETEILLLQSAHAPNSKTHE